MSGKNAEYILRNEAISSVRVKRPLLHRALDALKMDIAIRICVEITSELNSPKLQMLSPKSYYEVFLAVSEELRILESFVVTTTRSGQCSALELYEKVQYTEQVIPRLYLLITIGSALIATRQTSVHEVMTDLLDMCSAVQNPIRGLFLRTYLAQSMKDRLLTLHETSSVNDDGEPVFKETALEKIEFILRNFTEMNRLWVRMQYDCPVEHRKLRRKQRRELSILIGSTVMTLSKLEEMDSQLYKRYVLPEILEQIASCKESLAQEYLSECVVQVFPDDYHLDTLDEFLASCSEFQADVDVRLVIGALTDRLSRFALISEENSKSVREAQTFQKFRKYLPKIFATFAQSSATVEVLRTYSSLLRLVLAAYPDRMDCVDEVLSFCVSILQKLAAHEELTGSPTMENDGSALADDPDAAVTKTGHEDGQKETIGVGTARFVRKAPEGSDYMLEEGCEEENVLVQMISQVFEANTDISDRLRLSNFQAFIQVLSSPKRRRVASMLLESISEYKRCIKDEETLHKLFVYIDPLISGNSALGEPHLEHPYFSSIANKIGLEKEGPGSGPQSGSRNPLGFSPPAEEQGGQIGLDAVTAFEPNSNLPEDADIQEIDAGLGQVGRIVYLLDETEPERLFKFHQICFNNFIKAGGRNLRSTLPSLVFSSLRLAFRSHSVEALEQCLQMTGYLEELFPERALRFYLDVALIANAVCRTGSEEYILHCVERALNVLDARIPNSRAQLKAVTMVISTVTRIADGLSSTVYNDVSMSIVSTATELLTRGDKCRALCDCTDLFWHNANVRNTSKVIQCLKLATDSAMVIVSGLEKAIRLCDIFICSTILYENGCTEVGGRTIEKLVFLTKDVLEQQATSTKVKSAKARLTRAEKYVRDHPEVFGAFGITGEAS